MRAIIGVVTLSFLLGACASDGDVGGEPWMEVANYSYVLDSSCGDRVLIGSFEITVRDHVVSDVVALDESAVAMLNSSGFEHVPTLDDLVAEYRTAVQENAIKAEIQHAPLDGHPVTITIKWDKEAIGDEACYTVTGYTVSK